MTLWLNTLFKEIMVYMIPNQHEFIGDYTNNNLRFIPTKQMSLLLFEDAINLLIN